MESGCPQETEYLVSYFEDYQARKVLLQTLDEIDFMQELDSEEPANDKMIRDIIRIWSQRQHMSGPAREDSEAIKVLLPEVQESDKFLHTKSLSHRFSSALDKLQWDMSVRASIPKLQISETIQNSNRLTWLICPICPM
jgi:hypothetical protein